MDHTPQIEVLNLTKVFRVPERQPGLGAALRSLARRHYREVTAVHEITFTIQPGEIVGFIGPNGAGKTTTLKMLSGLLHPTRGNALVEGFTPWERKDEFLRRISMVLGNKSQMLWDIPPLDSFQVLAEIYHLSKQDYNRRLDELVDLMEIKDLLARPVRNLSLGERMKCELVAGLLHHPSVLFLDEPTLGLDVSMQRRLRRFIAEYNQRQGATVILTSHYMADVEALCPRVILIHEGKLQYDGSLASLAERLAPYKLIRLGLDSADPAPTDLELPPGAVLLESGEGHLLLRVERNAATSAASFLLNHYTVCDLTVEDPPLEAVMDRIYQGGVL